MKRVVFYFSGTGNSLDIAKRVVNTIDDTELLPIRKYINQEIDLTDAEYVGIVCPVYMWGLPLIVADFIKKLDIGKKAYVFLITTCGGLQGQAIKQAFDLFYKKGTKLSGGFSVRMAGNYIPLYDIPKKIDILHDKAYQKLDYILKRILNKECEVQRGVWVVEFLAGAFYKGSCKHIKKLDRFFWSDDKCTSSGICSKVCPVNNIDLVNGKPVWKGNCEQCFACIHWCPERAIQYKKLTFKKQRYHNKFVNLDDMFNKE
ncbi:EFR1 family ferrodoxin [bacterium]